MLEHDNMRKLIATLRALQPDGAGYDDAFRTLIREVLHHVADEETTLLPLAEEAMGDQLGTLGLQMTKRRMQLLKPHMRDVAAPRRGHSRCCLAPRPQGSCCSDGWLCVRAAAFTEDRC